MINKISQNIFQFYFNEFGSCIYLIKLNNKNILIDTSSNESGKEFLQDLEQLKLNPKEVQTILLTHSHWDHIGNLNLFDKAKIYDYKNKQQIEKDFPEIKVIQTPGHTKDSLCFLYKDVLFSGDTLFKNGIGRTDFPESQPEKMQESLEILKKLYYKILCPGHID